MDLTVAGAYMQVTNKALAKNAQTSVLEYKTKLGEKTLGIIDKQIEDYKKLNKKLEAEHERLVAEGERLVAEGEELKAQGERNRTHKKLRAYYKERHQNYSPERQRMYRTFLIKTELKDKIDTMISGYIIKKSSNETYDNMFSDYPKDKPITNALLRDEKSPKEV